MSRGPVCGVLRNTAVLPDAAGPTGTPHPSTEGAALPSLHELAECPLALVASPRIAQQYPDFVTPDRELAVPFIINEKACIFRQIFEQYLREKAILLAHTIELWSIPTIKNLVKSDLGVTFLPLFAVQEELNDGTLVRIPLDLDGRTITAVCAHHKNKWVSPLMKLFIDLLHTDMG